MTYDLGRDRDLKPAKSGASVPNSPGGSEGEERDETRLEGLLEDVRRRAGSTNGPQVRRADR